MDNLSNKEIQDQLTEHADAMVQALSSFVPVDAKPIILAYWKFCDDNNLSRRDVTG